MRTGKLLGALTLGLTIACIAAVAPVQASESVNVGDFIVQIARAKSLNSADPGIAADSLAAVGVRLPAGLDPAATLTEGDVTRLAALVGLRLSTSRPGAPFSRSQMQRFFATFGNQFAADNAGVREAEGENPGNGSGPGNGNGEPPFDPFSKGQGRKKGKAKMPTTEVDPT